MSEQQSPQMTFQIQRVYTKDISYEAPNSPFIFQKEWKPELKIDLDSKTSKLGDIVYEVTLRLTVTTLVEGEVAYLCEVQQAGIFSIEGIDGGQLAHCLGAYCPNILYPFARECVLNLSSKGTFPQVSLAPVNFDELFMNYLQEQSKQSAVESNPGQADA